MGNIRMQPTIIQIILNIQIQSFRNFKTLPQAQRFAPQQIKKTPSADCVAQRVLMLASLCYQLERSILCLVNHHSINSAVCQYALTTPQEHIVCQIRITININPLALIIRE